MTNLAYERGQIHHEINTVQDHYRKVMFFREFLFKYIYPQGIVINDICNLLNTNECFQAEVDMSRMIVKVKIKKTIMKRTYGSSYIHNSQFYSAIINNYIDAAIAANSKIIFDTLVMHTGEYPDLNDIRDQYSIQTNLLYNVVVLLDNIFEIRL